MRSIRGRVGAGNQKNENCCCGERFIVLDVRGGCAGCEIFESAPVGDEGQG